MAEAETACADAPACRVCGAPDLRDFALVGQRSYLRCGTCEATMLRANQLPSRQVEAEEYAHHRNEPADPRYRRFLSKLVDPLASRLAPNASGLDYGSGPGPAGAAMLRERGHRVREYDPIFSPDGRALEETYDFIFCAEVVEHFHRPLREFERLHALLRPGGWLGVMTCFQTDDAAFASWHYRRDPTHVAFYRPRTFVTLAARFGWRCEIPAKDVALLRR